MNTLKSTGIALALTTVVSFASLGNLPEPQTATPQVFYRTVKIDGLDIFYREAGRNDAPTVLLLHGFPKSSGATTMRFPRLREPIPTNVISRICNSTCSTRATLPLKKTGR